MPKTVTMDYLQNVLHKSTMYMTSARPVVIDNTHYIEITFGKEVYLVQSG